MSYPFSNDKPSSEQGIAESIPFLRRFIANRVNAKQDIDDLVQETILRTLKSTHHRKIDNLVAYAVTTAKTVVFDYWRSNNIEQEEFDEETNAPCNSLEAQQLNSIRLEAVSAIVESMPALRREVFIRRRLEGQSREEIAKELNISLDAVKKHINRALTDLVKKMHNKGWENE